MKLIMFATIALILTGCPKPATVPEAPDATEKPSADTAVADTDAGQAPDAK